MLKRAHIEGYRSLADVGVELDPLIAVVARVEPNALRPFDSPHRGAPLESSHMGRQGDHGHARHERVHQHREVERHLLLHCVERELTAMMSRFDDTQIDVNDLDHAG